jgi:hypothetical protein
MEGVETPTTHLAYCDDILIISSSPKGLQKLLDSTTKWLGKTGLCINTRKTSIMSNTPQAFSVSSGEHTMESTSNSFKYLGIWVSPVLDWTDAIGAATRAYTGKINKVKYRKVPLEVKSMVVNIMCNKALEYVTSFTGIPKYLAKKISNEAALFVKHAVPVRSTVSTKWVYTEKKKGGLGITHPETATKTALVCTYLRVLNDQPLQPLNLELPTMHT